MNDTVNITKRRMIQRRIQDMASILLVNVTHNII